MLWPSSSLAAVLPASCLPAAAAAAAMPKKLHSNPKAVEARERKETVKKEKQSAAAKAADDAKWADEGQSAAERRAAEKEKKRLDELKKKEQKAAAAARDEADMKAVKTVKVNPHKVSTAHTQTAHTDSRTRACTDCSGVHCLSDSPPLSVVRLRCGWLVGWLVGAAACIVCVAVARCAVRAVLLRWQVTIAQIQSTAASAERERARERAEEEKRRQRLLSQDELPTENVNQLERDRRLEEERQFGKGGVLSARSVDEALGSLSLLGSAAGTAAAAAEDDDRHPEKRLKAAYREYEEAHWDELKADNPSLRHSQLKELLWRQWQKAPSNPLNQAARREREAANETAAAAASGLD